MLLPSPRSAARWLWFETATGYRSTSKLASYTSTFLPTSSPAERKSGSLRRRVSHGVMADCSWMKSHRLMKGAISGFFTRPATSRLRRISINKPMNEDRWAATDEYICELCVPRDEVLEETLTASVSAGLPA